MIDGLILRITSAPSPRRSIAPGAKFSTMTSALAARSLTSARPFGSFRLTVMDFLLALNKRKYGSSFSALPPSARPGSPPPGFSSFTTSAPSQASASVQDGPASNWVRSRIFTPLRQGCPSDIAISSSSLCVGEAAAKPGVRLPSGGLGEHVAVGNSVVALREARMLFLVISEPRPEAPSSVLESRRRYWEWIAPLQLSGQVRSVYARVG